MRKKKIFLGGYINHINAQNINCKSIAKHLDKEKYIIKTLVVGSENIPNITGVTYIRVYTFLYSISNLIANLNLLRVLISIKKLNLLIKKWVVFHI